MFPLSEAIRRADYLEVQRLLRVDADVNRTRDGQPPLHDSIDRRLPYSIIQDLIKHGAFVEDQNSPDGRTALDLGIVDS